MKGFEEICLTVDMYFLCTICEFGHNAVTSLIWGAQYCNTGTDSISSKTFVNAVQT